MRAHRIAFVFLVASVASTLGCSSVARWQFVAARKLEQTGRFQSAATLYQTALRRIPAQDAHWRSEAFYRTGECLWSLGQIGEAFTNFERAVDADGNNTLARLRLGEIFLAGGALDRANEQAAAVLQAADGDTEALALLGAASSAAGQYQVAEAAFRKVLESSPSRVNIAVALADIYNREDREDEARRVLRSAADHENSSSLPLLALGRLEEQEGNSPAAEAAYRDAVAREDTPDTNLRLAQFLERSARVGEAEKILQRVDHMRPKQPTALPDFQLLAGRVPNALEQYLSAMRSSAMQDRRQQGGAASAVSGTRAALAARIIEADLQTATQADDPVKAAAVAKLHLDQYRNELDSPTLEMLRAELALAEDEVSTAEQHAASAVALAPKSAAAQYVLGLAKYRAGERTEARSAWLNAIQQDTNFVPARLALARESLRTGDAAGAEEYVLPTVREEPGNVSALELYGRVLLQQDRLAAATVIANRAVAFDSGAADAHVLLGEIALREGRYAESLLRFERAVLAEPRSLEALEGLVRVYRKGAITRPMLRNMETIAGNQPASATLMEIAGRLYAEHGWYDDAERSLRRTLEIDPQRTTAAAALAQVFAASGRIDAANESAAKVGGNTAALVSGLTAQQRNDIATAIQQYEAAVREGEHSGVAANNLAWLYAQEGTRLDRALSLAQRARAQKPKDPAVLDTVGVVHLRRREYSEAVDVLRDAASLASSPAYSGQTQLVDEIRRHLEEACLRSGMSATEASVAATRHDALRQRLAAPSIRANRHSSQ